MEELAEGLLRTTFRVAKWLLFELFVDVVLYWIGRGTLKLISFGRYPQFNDRAEGRCIFTGFADVVLVFVALIYLLPA
ncbi:hypothetical protein [Marisediminitalea sp.]|uniref:hypothetical protein n=1 Tax=Marisediminitalea sp. TaxID=2662268 RepID=UPI0035171758